MATLRVSEVGANRQFPYSGANVIDTGWCSHDLDTSHTINVPRWRHTTTNTTHIVGFRQPARGERHHHRACLAEFRRGGDADGGEQQCHGRLRPQQLIVCRTPTPASESLDDGYFDE